MTWLLDLLGALRLVRVHIKSAAGAEGTSERWFLDLAAALEGVCGGRLLVVGRRRVDYGSCR